MKWLVSVLAFYGVLGIVALSWGASATLTWTANTETDLAGYHVYRGHGACTTGPLQPLIDSATGKVVTLGKVTTFVDNTVPVFDGTLCYEITAVDTSANESPRSNRATKAVNLVPPIAPMGLVIGNVTP